MNLYCYVVQGILSCIKKIAHHSMWEKITAAALSFYVLKKAMGGSSKLLCVKKKQLSLLR